MTRSRCCLAAPLPSCRSRRAARPASSRSSTSSSTSPTAVAGVTEPPMSDPATVASVDDPPVETIRTPRLELVSMTIPVMRALQEKDLETAGRLAGAPVADGLADDLVAFLRYRLARLDAEPWIRQWLGRLIVLTDATGERHAIGTIGFH